jgi:hypothetical protein
MWLAASRNFQLNSQLSVPSKAESSNAYCYVSTETLFQSLGHIFKQQQTTKDPAIVQEHRSNNNRPLLDGTEP